MTTQKAIQIVGAGPSGLACAIVLARAGFKAKIYDRRPGVGGRFHDDFQGLENWTAKDDILRELELAGMKINFDVLPVRHGTAFDAWGHAYDINSNAPLYYLVRRGQMAGTLDRGLLQQALDLDVEIQFGHPIEEVDSPAVLAIGPRTADAIATGYIFETTMQNGSWICFNKELAPLGYSYLLVWQGRGTVASCMFTGFKSHQKFVDRTVAFFEKKAGLQMTNPRQFGGYANFRLPETATQGDNLVIGEQAGFQDALAGFGMGYAIRSGILAARSIIEGTSYTRLWRRELLPQLRTSVCNRFIFNVAGRYGHRYAIANHIATGDAREALSALYQPWWVTKLLQPIALLRYRHPLRDKSCDHIDCTCVWCEHGITGHPSQHDG
ncbi:NAD(P)/FAD-dependent oxidoreductase [Kordiimonas lipolytica]|uniref:NAD(P)/FAD-dependent oxidoreductase n=1 Tax=Kordiimonas lipolytica TaxID=1662421 RepID=A0ABV8U6M1_9PROT|nr:NAD(P)/FAD-dependent oxidoreductase [Kordiimonas lipolytica]